MGTYRVSVNPRLPEEMQNPDPAAMFNANGSTKKIAKVITKIPTRYQQVGSSGIEVVINEGPQTIQVEMTEKKK